MKIDGLISNTDIQDQPDIYRQGATKDNSQEIMLLDSLEGFISWLSKEKGLSFCRYFSMDKKLHRVPVNVRQLAFEFLDYKESDENIR